MKTYITDEFSGLEYVPLELTDTFSYECNLCGACCRNVKSSVPLEPLDIYKIAKHLCKTIEDVIVEYTDIEMIAQNFVAPFVKTKGAKDECIFLKDNLCTIQDCKPRTCRMYPMSASPGENGDLEYMWVAKEHHMYDPGKLLVRDWMNEALSPEDREFLRLEYDYVPELALLMRRFRASTNDAVIKTVMLHRYVAYDPTADFIPQNKNNMSVLLNTLAYI